MKLDVLVLRDVVLYTRAGATTQHGNWEQPWTDDVFLFEEQIYAVFSDDGFVWYCLVNPEKIPARLKNVPLRKLHTLPPTTMYKDWGKMHRVSADWNAPMLFVMASAPALKMGYTGMVHLTGAQHRSYPEEIFREQVRGGQSGRVIYYMQEKAEDSRCKLYFLPEGTGFFRGMVARPKSGYTYSKEYLDEIVEFTWDTSDVPGLADPADILTLPDARLLALCEQTLNEQIWPRLQNRHSPATDLSGEPEFFQGSRAELERLLCCICHLDDALWSREPAQGVIDVRCSMRYRGEDPLVLFTGKYFVEREGRAQTLRSSTEQMLDLALRTNRPRGGVWEPNSDPDDARVERFLHRGLHYHVQVASPSAHERAEALLTLSDWLDGKVSDKERKELIGLP